ncbi:gp436 family protein [Mannheimia pernigra]|uniref:gp436 family protein n=1 Tax=Mannheimia pernigra TaxID=111844 RepID=UPI00159F4AB3|nr:DUF1320 domain-containing protein [Mannheimia pernigra]QLB43541.1 DUF1320 domain-containing protein [Mannheimia pernigra]
MYIQIDELLTAFSRKIVVQLSNDEPAATEPNLTVLETAVKVANERVDAALRSRYTLPLTEVPTLINQHALTLARYWLYTRRPETKMPETVEKTYQQAVKELEQIALGKLHLGVAERKAEQTDDVLPDNSEYEVRANARIDTSHY